MALPWQALPAVTWTALLQLFHRDVADRQGFLYSPVIGDIWLDECGECASLPSPLIKAHRPDFDHFGLLVKTSGFGIDDDDGLFEYFHVYFPYNLLYVHCTDVYDDTTGCSRTECARGNRAAASRMLNSQSSFTSVPTALRPSVR